MPHSFAKHEWCRRTRDSSAPKVAQGCPILPIQDDVEPRMEMVLDNHPLVLSNRMHGCRSNGIHDVERSNGVREGGGSCHPTQHDTSVTNDSHDGSIHATCCDGVVERNAIGRRNRQARRWKEKRCNQ